MSFKVLVKPDSNQHHCAEIASNEGPLTPFVHKSERHDAQINDTAVHFAISPYLAEKKVSWANRSRDHLTIISSHLPGDFDDGGHLCQAFGGIGVT